MNALRAAAYAVVAALAVVRPYAAEKFNGHVFVKVKAGAYHLGAVGAVRNPPHDAALKAFEIATCETTNAQFARFVAATGYKTDAEKRGDGMTFHLGLLPFQWDTTKAATWRFPNGPAAGIDGAAGIEKKGNHPVTQVSYNDAQAYCAWAGLRLRPTTNGKPPPALAARLAIIGETHGSPTGAPMPTHGMARTTQPPRSTMAI